MLGSSVAKKHYLEGSTRRGYRRVKRVAYRFQWRGGTQNVGLTKPKSADVPFTNVNCAKWCPKRISTRLKTLRAGPRPQPKMGRASLSMTPYRYPYSCEFVQSHSILHDSNRSVGHFGNKRIQYRITVLSSLSFYLARSLSPNAVSIGGLIIIMLQDPIAMYVSRGRSAVALS